MAKAKKNNAVKDEAKGAEGATETTTAVEPVDEPAPHKAEGSLATIKVKDLHNNPHRSDEVFVWQEEKILGLQETFLVDGFQSTYEVSADKLGRVCLAGGGHHRTEALRRLIADGKGALVRGLFQDKDEDWCIKVVKKNYNNDQMLRNFMIENADQWGKDADTNVYLMTLQIRNFLDKMLENSTDVADFVDMVQSPYPLQMDERAYTRSKNAGHVSATTISQYLGENTWSRVSITKAIKIIDEPGEEGDLIREMAKKLPSIAMAYQFRNLMTDEEDGEKIRSSADDMKRAEKIIDTFGLNRKDLEDIDKLKKEKGLPAIDAITEFTQMKKEELKAEKDAKKSPTEPVQKKDQAPAEVFMEAMKHARNAAILAVDDVSKAQFNQAKTIFKDLAGTMQKISERFGGDK